MKKAGEFQGWTHQTHGSGRDTDLPATPSVDLGSEPGWAHVHSCLSVMLQSSKEETVRQRAGGRGGDDNVRSFMESVKAVCLTCVI